MTAPGDSDRTAAIPVPEGEPREPEILLRVAARTDKGMVRENNEDAFLVADLGPPAADGEKTQDVNRVGRKGVLLAVSDGMGGQEAGEVASRLAVETVLEALRKDWSSRPERDAVAELRNDLRMAVDRAHRAVLKHVEENPAREGMGATLTAAVVLGRKLVVAHLGDSRCYLLRDGFLKQLTCDQSLAEELARRGIVDRKSPAFQARRSVLTRVVGQAGSPEPDWEILDLARGDRLLLCTDGLHGPVEDGAIQASLEDLEGPGEALDGLLQSARGGGAPDNVTCIAAWLSGDGLPSPKDLDAGGTTVSVRLDSRLVGLADDDTLSLVQSKAEATGEFPVDQVKEDDTLSSGLPGAVASGAAGTSPTPAPASAPASVPTSAPAPGPAASPSPPPAPSPAPTPAPSAPARAGAASAPAAPAKAASGAAPGKVPPSKYAPARFREDAAPKPAAGPAGKRRARLLALGALLAVVAAAVLAALLSRP